jgi:hypothetical protein
MKRLCHVLMGLSLLVALVGCQAAPPSLFDHGTAQYQQKEAERFDPYPDNQAGPTVLGSRPLDYKEPRSEVRRAQWWPWDWFQK